MTNKQIFTALRRYSCDKFARPLHIQSALFLGRTQHIIHTRKWPLHTLDGLADAVGESPDQQSSNTFEYWKHTLDHEMAKYPDERRSVKF